MFGAQRMEEGQLVETVLANTWDPGMNGTENSFAIEGGESTYSQKGTMLYEGEDDYKLEEHFSRVE